MHYHKVEEVVTACKSASSSKLQSLLTSNFISYRIKYLSNLFGIFKFFCSPHLTLIMSRYLIFKTNVLNGKCFEMRYTTLKWNTNWCLVWIWIWFHVLNFLLFFFFHKNNLKLILCIVLQSDNRIIEHLRGNGSKWLTA